MDWTPDGIVLCGCCEIGMSCSLESNCFCKLVVAVGVGRFVGVAMVVVGVLLIMGCKSDCL